MDPEQLTALVDDETRRVLGIDPRARRSPWPRLATPGAAWRARGAAVRPRRERDVRVVHVYPLATFAGWEERAAVLAEAAVPHGRVLVPRLPDGTLWAPGYVFLGLEEPIGHDEIQAIRAKRAGRLNAKELPPADAAMVLLLDQGGEGIRPSSRRPSGGSRRSTASLRLV